MTNVAASPRTFSWVAALALGVVAALAAVLASEFLLGTHRIDFASLPPAVQTIAQEGGNNPISSEQWKRMDEAMKQHGGWPGGQALLAASIRKGWPFFLVFPVAVLLVVRLSRRAVSALSVFTLFSPSFAVAAWAALSAGPHLAG